MSMPPERKLDTIVIGASAGGFEALIELAAALPPCLPASLLVVLHVGAHPNSLPQRLSAAGPLPAHHAQDGEPLLPGRIYVALPDRHLLVADDSTARVVKGPKENFARPAIDPLFRSAALARSSRVIGVVLTGMLDDGAAGLLAVRERGGVTIVQDPRTADAPDMPRNAMARATPHHVLPLADIAPKLALLAGSPAGPQHAAPREAVPDQRGAVASGRTLADASRTPHESSIESRAGRLS